MNQEEQDKILKWMQENHIVEVKQFIHSNGHEMRVEITQRFPRVSRLLAELG
jgi:predicted HAD superfamily phosphohydrolase YqeG